MRVTSFINEGDEDERRTYVRSSSSSLNNYVARGPSRPRFQPRSTAGGAMLFVMSAHGTRRCFQWSGLRALIKGIKDGRRSPW